MISQLPRLQAQQLLLAAVRSSAAGGWDHLVPSLVRLGCALLDVPPPANHSAPLMLAAASSVEGEESDEAERARLPEAVRTVLLGRHVLLECFRLHPMVRSELMDEVCSRIVTRGDAVHHWVNFLRELVQSQVRVPDRRNAGVPACESSPQQPLNHMTALSIT